MLMESHLQNAGKRRLECQHSQPSNAKMCSNCLIRYDSMTVNDNECFMMTKNDDSMKIMKHSMSMSCPRYPFNEAPIGWRDRGADRDHATGSKLSLTQFDGTYFLCHFYIAMTLPWCSACSTHNWHNNFGLFRLLDVEFQKILLTSG